MAAVTVTSATALWFSLLSLANANVHLGAPQVGEGKNPVSLKPESIINNVKTTQTWQRYSEDNVMKKVVFYFSYVFYFSVVLSC